MDLRPNSRRPRADPRGNRHARALGCESSARCNSSIQSSLSLALRILSERARRPKSALPAETSAEELSAVRRLTSYGQAETALRAWERHYNVGRTHTAPAGAWHLRSIVPETLICTRSR